MPRRPASRTGQKKDFGMSNIYKNTPKNNFAHALASLIIDAAKGRGDIRLFDEPGDQPPLEGPGQ